MNYTEIITKVALEIKNLENKKKELYDKLEKEKNINTKQLIYRELYVINLSIEDLQEQMFYLLDNW